MTELYVNFNNESEKFQSFSHPVVPEPSQKHLVALHLCLVVEEP